MKPSTEDITQILVHIAPELADGDVNPEADLVNELDIDSMDFLEFLTALSTKYQVEIPETDYSKLATLSGCAAYLADRLS